MGLCGTLMRVHVGFVLIVVGGYFGPVLGSMAGRSSQVHDVGWVLLIEIQGWQVVVDGERKSMDSSASPVSTPAPCLSPQIPSRISSSSMLRHGLAPAYKSEGRRVESDGMSTTMDPNSHPLASLNPSHARRGMRWRYSPPGTLTGASCTNHPPNNGVV